MSEQRGSLTDPATGPTASRHGASLHDGTSLVALGRQLIDDATRLVRQELELAKEEIKELLLTNLKGAAFLLGAAILAFIAFIMLQVAILLTVPFNVQFIVAWALFGFWIILTIVLALIGKARLRFQAPEKTISTIKGDIEWAKGQIHSNGK